MRLYSAHDVQLRCDSLGDDDSQEAIWRDAPIPGNAYISPVQHC